MTVMEKIMQVAQEGCIGCGLCARNCPCDAIHVENKQAMIDYDTCIACGMCAVKCPKGVISDARGIFS